MYDGPTVIIVFLQCLNLFRGVFRVVTPPAVDGPEELEARRLAARVGGNDGARDGAPAVVLEDLRDRGATLRDAGVLAGVSLPGLALRLEALPMVLENLRPQPSIIEPRVMGHVGNDFVLVLDAELRQQLVQILIPGQEAVQRTAPDAEGGFVAQLVGVLAGQLPRMLGHPDRKST